MQPLSRSRRQITQNVAGGAGPGAGVGTIVRVSRGGRGSTDPPPPIIYGRTGRRWRLAGGCGFRSGVPLFAFSSGWPSRANVPSHPVCACRAGRGRRVIDRGQPPHRVRGVQPREEQPARGDGLIGNTRRCGPWRSRGRGRLRCEMCARRIGLPSPGWEGSPIVLSPEGAPPSWRVAGAGGSGGFVRSGQ